MHTSITFISKISYSMYLLNLTVVQLNILPAVLEAIGLSGLKSGWASVLSLVIFWAITIALSYVVHRFWEMPVMKLRDKFSISSSRERTSADHAAVPN